MPDRHTIKIIMKRISIHLPEKDIKWLNDIAIKVGISRAEYLRRIIYYEKCKPFINQIEKFIKKN